MSARMVVFAEGAFGAAVGGLLARQTGAVVHGFLESAPSFAERIAGAEFVAVALWRLYESELQQLDEAAAAAGVPWSSAYPLQEMLYCGPLIVPRTGPCWACFQKRYRTHSPAADWEAALREAYRRDPARGPRGFAPPMAWIAASALIGDAREVGSAAGRLRRVDVCTGRLLETCVVRVHQCARCGRRVAGGRTGERFVDALAPAVRHVLTASTSDPR
jgi:bacteriocin biosynthesis cyclodehydratase domain-containing protein